MSDNKQRIHGDAQGVFHMDTANGAIAGNAIPANTCVNFIGGAFDFFNVQTGVSLAAEMGPGGTPVRPGAVQTILTTIAQTATIMMYQVDSGTGGNLSVAVYPKGAWAVDNTGPEGVKSNLIAVLNAITSTGVGNVTLAGATVTNTGFKLATT